VRLARRAGIVLLTADGLDNRRIAELVGVGRIQVGRWRERCAARGLKAIEQDLPRAGRKPKVDPAEIVRLTTQTEPQGAREHSDARGGRGERRAPLEGAWPEATPGKTLQGIARSQVRREAEARRYRRSVYVPARPRAGAVLRREEPGAGARSHPARLADEARPSRQHDP